MSNERDKTSLDLVEYKLQPHHCIIMGHNYTDDSSFLLLTATNNE